MNYVEIINLAVLAFVFCELLITEGEILSFWLPWCKKVLHYDTNAFNVKFWNKAKAKLLSILGSCAKCFSGQLALWYYIFNYGPDWNLIYFVAFTILLTHFLTVTNGWYTAQIG